MPHTYINLINVVYLLEDSEKFICILGVLQNNYGKCHLTGYYAKYTKFIWNVFGKIWPRTIEKPLFNEKYWLRSAKELSWLNTYNTKFQTTSGIEIYKFLNIEFVKFLLSGIIRGSKYASEEEALKAPCGK